MLSCTRLGIVRSAAFRKRPFSLLKAPTASEDSTGRHAAGDHHREVSTGNKKSVLRLRWSDQEIALRCIFPASVSAVFGDEEYETLRVTHHPEISEDDAEGQALRVRLRQLREKEGTLAREKRHEARGKSGVAGQRFLRRQPAAPTKTDLCSRTEACERNWAVSQDGGKDSTCGEGLARARSAPRGTICAISGGRQHRSRGHATTSVQAPPQDSTSQ